MRNSLGISAGAAGVCTALVTTDESGTHYVEYRTLSLDTGSDTGLGDLTLSAIDLMTIQVPDCRIEPDAIAVAYRSESHASTLRSAAKRQRRDIRLVPETVATLTYLRSTGLVDRYGTIGIVDLGASGLTVTVVDRAEGTVHRRERTHDVSGDAAATTPGSTIGERVAEFTNRICRQALRVPEAVVLVGGGANIPEVGQTLEPEFEGPVIMVPEPEAATAKGTALLAVSGERQEYPVVAGTGGHVSGALIGALVVGLLVLGYGLRTVVPRSPENFAPTSSDVVQVPDDVPAVLPEETGIPTEDPDPTSEQPLPYTPPIVTTAPMSSHTSTAVPPRTVTSETPSTKPELPWIPPKWPELPTGLPDLVPPPTSSSQQPSQTPTTSPTVSTTPSAPETSASVELPTTEVDPPVSPESGSPTPEAPDS
ncbi:exopolyphosphatase [Rhodococcus sp. ABRD24]|uniref:exopolyphosphatase n=1 Tax=Rhodococcus sp. ABRD24 TaxID=2507582 RepID=UPI001038B03F|nr:exopolyphosphatase [Rhodococcus sp. ABRD24]QBJ95491.1 exopolyphosphatase [Rhodococcus sp. ABRD24]